MEFTKKELEAISQGLELYKVRLKKLLRDSQQVGAGEKEIKMAFLQTETLINKIQQ